MIGSTTGLTLPAKLPLLDPSSAQNMQNGKFAFISVRTALSIDWMQQIGSACASLAPRQLNSPEILSYGGPDVRGNRMCGFNRDLSRSTSRSSRQSRSMPDRRSFTSAIGEGSLHHNEEAPTDAQSKMPLR